jgi:hypothetical protein
VALSKIQSEVLRLLAAHRDPESYVGGATPLNRDAPRFSADIDVFHDREERVAEAALNDAAVLEKAGYKVEWLRRLPLIYTAGVVGRSGSLCPANADRESGAAVPERGPCRPARSQPLGRLSASCRTAPGAMAYQPRNLYSHAGEVHEASIPIARAHPSASFVVAQVRANAV